MSTTQRLRLVLVLGVVNLVLATVALGFGLTAPAPSSQIGAVPTSGTALATSTPTTTGGAPPTAATTAPASRPTPGRPAPSIEPGGQATPVPSGEPSVEPSVLPSVEPSPEPPAEPSAVPSELAAPQATALPKRAPVVAVRHPSTPAPLPATPAATAKVPEAGGPDKPACHASERGRAASNGKACPPRATHRHTGKAPKGQHKGQHDNGRHRGAQAQRHGGQGDRQPAIVESRPASKSRHRLRTGHRAR